MHSRPHDVKLGESNRLTTNPLSCLFSRTSKYDERDDMEVSSVEKTAVNCKRKTIKSFAQLMSAIEVAAIANNEDCNETLKYPLYYMAEKLAHCDWLRTGKFIHKCLNQIAKRASDVMAQTRLRQTNWNGG